MLSKKTIVIFVVATLILIGLGLLINHIITSSNKKPPLPPQPNKDTNVVKAYLESIYPTSDKIKRLSIADAESYYKNLWFYYLVLDFMGTKSTTINNKGENVDINGTLLKVDNLMPNIYKDGAIFFHPNSVTVKNPDAVFYNDAGKSGTPYNKVLASVSNGKYIEISSFGLCPYPNGIYLNSAKGSGIFWNPGNILVGPNKLAIIYISACKIKKVTIQEGVYSDSGKKALLSVLNDSNTKGGKDVLNLINEIATKTSSTLDNVIKAHVVDDRKTLKNYITYEAVSTYDPVMTYLGLENKYDSCMMIAQPNADGSFDIEFCDFRVNIQGSFGSGKIDDNIQEKWEIFSSNYLSVRDPFDINNESNVKQLDIVFPKIMFSGYEDATNQCNTGPNCGPEILEDYNGKITNKNTYCQLTGCLPADTPKSWKNGKQIFANSKNPINLYDAGGISFAINNGKNGLSMISKSMTTGKILEKLKNPVLPQLSQNEIKSLLTNTDLSGFIKTLNINTPKNLEDGLRNYLKLTYPLSSKFWDTLDKDDLVNIYLELNAHYMPLILPIGKMSFSKYCKVPSSCIFPPSKNSRTQYWAFDGVHLEGAAGSAINKDAYPTKNYPDSTPYWYQHVDNPFNGGPHAIFDGKDMTLTQGGYPNYAWVESVQYADEAGGIRLQGEYQTKNKTIIGPLSCTSDPPSDSKTFVETPIIENFSGDIPCDKTNPCKTQQPKDCSIGQKCSRTGCQSYCSIPDTTEDCAITYDGQTPPSKSICGYMDMKNQKWVSVNCSDKDACKWALANDMTKVPTSVNLFNCIKNNPADPNNCAQAWSVPNKDIAETVTIPVTTTMYYPQKGYGRFTNYGKTGIYYSNVSVLLTIPDLNLRMKMEQIIQLVGNSVGGLSIHNQLEALLSKNTKDPRYYLSGYVVLPNNEYNKLRQDDKTKVFKIQNKRNVICENPLINPGDDPRLKNILNNFTALYIPPEAKVKNPNYNKSLSYDYETAIQLLMAMYIHGCTGNHQKNNNYPFGSYNSYGMVLGHLAYVRTKAMGWNTIQLARDPDYSGNSMKYCEWPFYDYEIIHVAADPPKWFKPSMADSPNPKYPNETDGYGFDLSVGGVWADESAAKPYVFCKGMFTMDISKYLSFYINHGYLPGSGNWNLDVELFNPQYINRNIFRQGQLPDDQFATKIRNYYTNTSWGADPILYDQTCPFSEWKGHTCSSTDQNCVETKAGQGIYYQAMHSTTPLYSWPLGKKQ